MLKYIKITNFALIEEAEAEFLPGFNVVTGESGAGKSILLGAIGQLLGDRAEKSVLRSGTDRATVSGIFSVPEELREELKLLLDEAGVPESGQPGELAFRRVITPSGARNFLNDTPVGIRLMAAAGAVLVDRQQVNEQLSLTSPSRQLELLDRYAALASFRSRCAAACAALARLAEERAEFEQGLPDAAEADRLEQMISDINRVAPEAGEDEKLGARCRLAANGRQIVETARELSGLLNDNEDSVADRLGTVYHHLAELERLGSDSVSALSASCSALQESVGDLARAIAELAESVDLDPAELAAAEERLSDIYTLKRRYGPSLEELFDRKTEAEKRLELFASAAGKRQEFDRTRRKLEQALAAHAAELSRLRRAAVKDFLAAVVEKLRAIGFEKCRFDAAFSDVSPSPSGADRMELLFSANPGEDLRPLRSVASSGELSRLMLALKQVLASADAVPTVIFDEIDMNIGGETANHVGDELRELGKLRQIICISHLAQVAARADRHFRVVKEVENDRTVSVVESLKHPAEELARMLGGGADAARHAAGLLKATAKVSR